MGRVGFLGPEGSYSEIAASALRPEDEKAAYPNFALLMRALSDFEVDAVAAPIENSINGGVLQNMDLLQSTPGVIAVRECTVQIDHRLATLPGASLCDIKNVYSHRQALDQCSQFIADKLPRAVLHETASTAASLDEIKTKEDAGIVGGHFKKEGIVLSEENIADEKSNFTHFLLIVRGTSADVKTSERIYFSFTCRDEPGALLYVLQYIADGKLNMNKIESRPVKSSPGEYRFFVEVDGDIADEKVLSTLSRIREYSKSFKILGAY